MLKENEIEQQVFDQIKANFVSKESKLIYAGELLQLACKHFADRVALECENQFITFKEFYFRSILLSKKLQNLNIKSRDRVLLYFENSVEFYIAYFAILQVGAVVVPLNVYLHPKELAHIVKDSGACLGIISNSLKPTWDKLTEINLVEPEKLPQVLMQDSIDWQMLVPENFEEILDSFKIAKLDPEELTVLLYTSGTTGVPKGVMLSSKNMIVNAMQAYARLTMVGKEEKERFFSVLPLFHSFAQCTCVWLPVMLGACVIIVKKIDRKLILEGLKRNPTIFLGFPALYGLLCLLKTAPLDSIRIFVSGADLLPDKIRSAFSIVYGRKICAGYGLTEASPVVALNYHNHAAPTDFVGSALMGIESDVRDEDGKTVDVNQIGTLWIKGDNIMMGYYNCPDATAKTLKDGWLNTGDFATKDANGKLAIKGRNKDLIIHKGFNIYPQEVENILLSHPMVMRAAVIGKEDPLSGQIPVAFVSLKTKTAGIEESLKELCTSNLAQYKIPRKFICLDELPMSSTGKIDKKQLQLL